MCYFKWGLWEKSFSHTFVQSIVKFSGRVVEFKEKPMTSKCLVLVAIIGKGNETMSKKENTLLIEVLKDILLQALQNSYKEKKRVRIEIPQH